MNSSHSDPWIGRLIGDRQRYRLEKRLGVGGMGDVFLATDTLLSQQVALKLLKDALVTSEELRKRFEREVRVSAALKNEHIVQVSDYGISAEGYPFYVMEYLRGQSLGQLLRREERLSIERTLSIITQVCDGLHQAHQGVTLWRNNAIGSVLLKVVHRDLKPDNIFLVSTVLGELVKILDFGIAKIREDTAEHTQLTNMFLGTYHYASPEQLEVETNIDGRADIYSLGIILYEMLSGTDPFGLGLNTRKISEISWAMAHTSKLPQPLRSQVGLSELPPELEAAVMRCLQKVPSERFASVDELKQALQAAIATQQPSISSPTSFDWSVYRPLTPSPSVPPAIKITQTRPPSAHGSNDATIDRPLKPPQQGSNNATVDRPLTLPDDAIPEAILSLDRDSLLEIIAEIIGPIASTLIREISVSAPNAKELVENLMLYLSGKQRIEFKKKAVARLQQNLTRTQAKSSNSPTIKNQAINTSFLKLCEEYLAEIIGPIAPALIQEALESHAQISPEELVNSLAKEIPNSKKAQEFSQRLLANY
ncbi:MAG: serine/threonine-protein kinase [Rhizonema sp. PD38]|nr:serine/threonine-protein kinase [Rhizonema sp. PD38]